MAHARFHEGKVAALSLGIEKPLDLCRLRVLAAVPLQGQFLDGSNLEPSVLAPDLDVRLIALVEVVAGEHGSEAAVVEAQAEGGRVLDVDRLAADDAGEAGDLFDLQSGDVKHQIEPVNADPDELSAAGAGLLAEPRLAIRRVLEAGLIGDQMDLDGVDLPEFAGLDESPGLANGSVGAVGKGHHQMAVLRLRFGRQLREVRRFGAGRFLGVDVAARFESGVNDRRGRRRFQAHDSKLRLEFLEHHGGSGEDLGELAFELLAGGRDRFPAGIDQGHGFCLVDLRQGAEVIGQMSALGLGDHSNLDRPGHRRTPRC